MSEFLSGQETEMGVERENLEPQNPITIYYLRHGESAADKTDPLRGLTEKGVHQVVGAIERVTEEIPDRSTQIRLYSSGSERTQEQCIVAADVLKREGFSNMVIDRNSFPKKKVEFTPEGVTFSQAVEGEEQNENARAISANLGLKVGGPGIKERIAELKAPAEYMQKIRALEKETGIGAVIHWLMDKDLPKGAESPEEKAKIIEGAIDIVQRLSERIKGNGGQPFVALVFGHASALTAYGSQKFNIEPQEMGEIENAEGVKINFTGERGSRPEVIPFGHEIERKTGRR